MARFMSEPRQDPTEIDGVSVDRIKAVARESGIPITHIRGGGLGDRRNFESVLNQKTARAIAPDVAKLDGINAETKKMQGQLTAMKETDVRRTRSALQPQSNLFSLLGQGQGRNTLG